MTNSNTPRSRAARVTNATRWAKKRVADGGCRLSLLLPAPDAERLRRLAIRYGTKKAAICAGLEGLEGELCIENKTLDNSATGA